MYIHGRYKAGLAEMNPYKVLNEIYQFTVPSTQTISACISYFCQFCNSLNISDKECKCVLFTNDELKSIKKVATVLQTHLTKEELSIEWFPEYGAAIVCFPDSGWSHLKIVGLDDWSFRVHASGTHFATCRNSFIEELVKLQASSFETYITRVREEITVKASRARAARSTGYQKTPAFIASMFQQNECPKGGTTDVGQHQGSETRCTSWPLVREVFKRLIVALGEDAAEESQNIFRRAMLCFDLYALGQLLLLNGATVNYFNIMMTVMEAAGKKIIQFSVDSVVNVDYESLCTCIEDARVCLNKSSEYRNKLIANKFIMYSVFIFYFVKHVNVFFIPLS